MSSSSSSSSWRSGSSARSSPSPLRSPSGSTEMAEIDPFLETPIVCCGGKDAGQDVFISLILPGFPEEETDYLPPLAEVRVHSSPLRTCSTYYATALGPPCPKRKRTPIECKLEICAHESVYCDCFARMYTPLRKNFGDVSYALQLLRVANQIAFEELSRAICSYLSSVQWSGDEEYKIRRYVASPDFPRGHAEELVARVQRKEGPCASLRLLVSVRLLIQQCMHSLHNVDKNSSRALLQELLKTAGGRHSECATFEQDVALLINAEAKRLIEDVHINYDSRGESFQQVRQLRVVRHVLEVLVEASLGEAGVKCFLRLQNYPSTVAHAARSLEWEMYVVATEFARLILSICAEVVVGNLRLGTGDRVLLLKNWRPLFRKLDMMESFKPLARSLFATLPLAQRMELINDADELDNYDTYVSSKSFVRLLLELINDAAKKDNYDTYVSSNSFVRLLKDQYVASC